jgi:hypothetical protein
LSVKRRLAQPPERNSTELHHYPSAPANTAMPEWFTLQNQTA